MKKWWLDVISGRTMVKNGGFTEKYGDFTNLSWLNGVPGIEWVMRGYTSTNMIFGCV
jgi:hypothetical protein